MGVPQGKLKCLPTIEVSLQQAIAGKVRRQGARPLGKNLL